MRQSYYLHQRKTGGLISVVFIDPISGNRTERTTGTNDKKRANAIAQDWLTNGLPDKPNNYNIARKTTFCDFLHQFWDFDNSEYFRELETMGKEPNPEHALEMQKAVKRYYRDYFQAKLLCQIDEETLQEFVVYLKTVKNLAASTVNSARNAAFVALKYAKRKKYIKNFDFDAVLRAGGKSKDRGILENEEAKKLFELTWPNEMARLICLISYKTGIRLGEARCLRVCDISERKITVKHSWSSKKKREKSTKNNESRYIPISLNLYTEIMKYIKEKGFMKLDALLFPGKKPEIPFDSVQIRKIYYKMLTSIGIDEETRNKRGIVFHSFRHQLAKNLVEKGVNKAIGMKILGHKTSIVFDKYADHIDTETRRQMEEAIEKVEQPVTQREPIPFIKAV